MSVDRTRAEAAQSSGAGTDRTRRFIHDRVDNQIVWFSRKSARNKRLYRSLRLTEIVLAAAIPVIAGISITGSGSYPVLTGICGAGVAILAGALELFDLQENWIRYRAASETLKHVKMLFSMQVTPYEGPDAFPRFVGDIEAVITGENARWAGELSNKDGRSDPEVKT
jgi:hypothetical protein